MMTPYLSKSSGYSVSFGRAPTSRRSRKSPKDREPFDNARETLAFLTLGAARGVGHKSLTELADANYRFAEAVTLDPHELVSAVPRLNPKADSSTIANLPSVLNEARLDALRMLETLESKNIQVIFRDDPGFPQLLMELERPPHWLFVQGAVPNLTAPSVAIVGTRKPSGDGLFLARYVGACLRDWGVATVSGLAAGIDQLAHEASLRNGVPTIAILGTGILDDYPSGSGPLRERILAAGGTVISEYLPKATYSGANFVQRNRLQAALSRVLIPVEWARKSGTAHTVRFAAELHRPIACVRLADWPTEQVVLEPGLGLESGAIFTLPRQQNRFDEFVRQAVTMPVTEQTGQLSLFGED